MTKQKRQEKILELIKDSEIATQEELAAKLRDAGFAATQATVSRDIRELKLIKLSGKNKSQKYEAPDLRGANGDKYMRVLREGLLSVDHAQNILVLKTVSGMAMAVGAALDAMQFEEIVGCIAGDDTVMAAVRTIEDTRAVTERIRRIIPG